MTARALLAAALAASALAACAPRETAAPSTGAAHPAPDTIPRLPDIPDAFRAELRAGRLPSCPLDGQAVHLGNGRFLTAAHLVDDSVPRLRHCAGTPAQPTIRYAGRTLPVRAIHMGEGRAEAGIGVTYRGGQDLALLQAGTVPPGPAARPCASGPIPGQPVRVLSTPRDVLRAGPMVPEARAADGAYADLPVLLAQGESGSGVVDAESHCLLGIVSHRPEATPGHTRIVPAAAIRAFLDVAPAIPAGRSPES
ncbi:trypsin-like peptidase domain-containing protein [Roseomonas sp. WA12]